MIASVDRYHVQRDSWCDFIASKLVFKSLHIIKTELQSSSLFSNSFKHWFLSIHVITSSNLVVYDCTQYRGSNWLILNHSWRNQGAEVAKAHRSRENFWASWIGFPMFFDICQIKKYYQRKSSTLKHAVVK